MAGVVAQLYAGVYLGWFLIVGLGLAAVVALAMPSCRGHLLEVVRRDAWAIAAAGAGGALLLATVRGSLSPGRSRGRASSTSSCCGRFTPSLGPGSMWAPRHWFWGWAAHPGWAGELAFLEGEHHLGIGFLTPIACAVGLYLGRAWPICRLAAVVAFILWFATTYMPGDHVRDAGGRGQLLLRGRAVPRGRRTGLASARAGGRGVPVALIRFPNPYLMVLGLDHDHPLPSGNRPRARAPARALIAPGIALAVISLKFFDLETILHGIVMVGPGGGLLAYYGRSRRWEVGLGSLALLVLFLIVITFLDRAESADRARWRPPRFRWR